MARGKNLFDMYRNKLSLVLSKLEGLSPLKILSRGYSVTRKADGRQVIRSIESVQPGDRIETLLHDGQVISTVETATKEERYARK
jgi:exodeoxyribonuclease VII large subunit